MCSHSARMWAIPLWVVFLVFLAWEVTVSPGGFPGLAQQLRQDGSARFWRAGRFPFDDVALRSAEAGAHQRDVLALGSVLEPLLLVPYLV